MEDIDDPMSDDEIEERVKGTDDKANEGNVININTNNDNDRYD